MKRAVSDSIYYVGVSDRRLALFENTFPLPNGVSYNSYLIDSDRTALTDTVDRSVADVFFDNLAEALGSKPLDYLVVHHVEPDHAATVADLLLRYPDVKIVTSAKALVLLNRFNDADYTARTIVVKEGDILDLGKHTLRFVAAPMVHWPEVFVSYETATKTLFSADAFGTFGALGGNLFADEIDFDRDIKDEMRRYFINIVGKYGVQVQNLLKKAASLEIAAICPLHGPIWRNDLGKVIALHDTWSAYRPEDQSVVIACASIYGNTARAADYLADRLAERGIKGIRIYDVSKTHVSYVVAEAFRASHVVFAAPTYNNGIFIEMEHLLHDLVAHNFRNRRFALIENGSWAPQSGKLMQSMLSALPGVTQIGETVTVCSALNADARRALDCLAEAVASEF